MAKSKQKPCSIDGCSKPAKARGWCTRHWERWRRTGNPQGSKPRTVKHGDFGTKLYGVWNGMKSRCYNPSTNSYHNYGGRGIAVCDEWLDYIPFRDWAIANGYVEGLSIERIDNNGNYCSENCKWVDNSAQQRNKRTNVNITCFGETKCMKDWADDLRYSLTYSQIIYRKHAGWTDEDIITVPKQPNQNGSNRKLKPDG